MHQLRRLHEGLPPRLITSVPVSKKVHVACANLDKGKAAMSVCGNSCIGCGLCEKECKKDAIHVVNGVAVIDYDKCVGCKLCTKVCPRDAILPRPPLRRRKSIRPSRRLRLRRPPLPRRLRKRLLLRPKTPSTDQIPARSRL